MGLGDGKVARDMGDNVDLKNFSSIRKYLLLTFSWFLFRCLARVRESSARCKRTESSGLNAMELLDYLVSVQVINKYLTNTHSNTHLQHSK